ncbi:hypothetical protein LDENG_00159270 [Lucifuga dentata]|nr:hypothetical protein LDENG_00159270 [Lucifuga dentata]
MFIKMAQRKNYLTLEQAFTMTFADDGDDGGEKDCNLSSDLESISTDEECDFEAGIDPIQDREGDKEEPQPHTSVALTPVEQSKPNTSSTLPSPPSATEPGRRSIMSRDRFRAICWNIHMSDPRLDEENERKRGTADYDSLFCTRPLLDSIRTACQAYYHPRKELAIDERMVATKAKTGMTQYMKDKLSKWEFILFVLTDSSNGYTQDFFIYTGKTKTPSANGLSYDSVMTLIKPAFLGGGYSVYVDNFYTSSTFQGLSGSSLWSMWDIQEQQKRGPSWQRQHPK